MSKTETPSPTDEPTDETDSIENELDTILPGNAPLANLRVVQTGLNHYRVLSARNGHPTAHKVDLTDMSCTCEDMEWNREGREVCAHVARVMVDARQQIDLSGLAASEIAQLMTSANAALEKAKDARDTYNRTQEANEVAERTETAESDTADSQEVPTDDRENPAAKVRNAMESQYGVSSDDMDDVDVWVHDEYGSVQIEVNGYIDGDGIGRALFRNDLVEYDPDTPGADNYVPAGDVDAYARGEGA